MEKKFNLLSIIGPTACGKTTLAVRLAAELDGEIISADSRQVYRGMDIGTGKDLEEYQIEGRCVPYHLIDLVDAGYKYNVFEYQRDFMNIWVDCSRRGVVPVLCGGSGLYVEAVLKGYKLLAVPVNEELRATLTGLSLQQLAERLATYKKLHNTTEIDTPKRAVRSIEIEEYYASHPCEEKDFPEIHPLI
ncbi:MAG: isopentenyl transferase family protein, partial [Odoribacter sp.]